jgi:hypothetical protein
VDVIELAPKEAAETLMQIALQEVRFIESTGSTLIMWQSPPFLRITKTG